MVEVAQRDVKGFAICFSDVRKHQRSIEIDFCHTLERELALSDVPLVLDRVKVDFHGLERMYKEVMRQGLLYAHPHPALARESGGERFRSP